MHVSCDAMNEESEVKAAGANSAPGQPAVLNLKADVNEHWSMVTEGKPVLAATNFNASEFGQ